HTAGGRVRFRTDSEYLVLRAILADCAWMGHMAFLGSCGFAVYVERDGVPVFYKSLIPLAEGSAEARSRIEGVIRFPDRRPRDITVYLPLYSGVEDLWFGLQADASLEEGGRYRYEVPVLYYGSSITQGGCASRPGNSYEGFISRRLDCDYINLGFSGNGKAETAMAEYLAELDASVFVMDYDHNAPDAAYLEQTHERLYRIYRAKNPAVPVIMVSRPDFGNDPHSAGRRSVILRTYENARKQGDQNVYFIDGEQLFQRNDPAGSDCTVDGCHPNDLGFFRMAEKIGAVVEQCLENH
ncbi:MAG: SGNH/GDSL hydrolase family protein, partial [Oscillospiraceae bacterium]|nr:SGNH/GDSL hydrolase family protein [Oscillospiraceae bacterium]